MSALTEAARSVSTYAAEARDRSLPPQVAERARLHILDTVAATVSGSVLPGGRAGQSYVAALGGTGSASVHGTRVRTSSTAAALANGMAAHADETDDSHEASTTHPGCAVVPAAFAAAESFGGGGRALLNAVAFGYDLGTRFVHALGPEALDLSGSAPSSHAFGGLFGAGFAAGSLMNLDADGFVELLSYLGQEVSGITTWLQDGEHVLKAYVFGGMPATNGTRCAELVRLGFSGSGDVLDPSRRNLLDAFSRKPDLGRLTAQLGERHAIAETNLKRYSVGSPIQAAVQALEELLERRPVAPDEVEEIRLHLNPWLADIVDGRSMPDVNVQYCLAATILDRGLSFQASHDQARMGDPEAVALMARVRVLRTLPDPPRREARVEISLAGGDVESQHADNVLGTTGNPMSLAQVESKALELMTPILGEPSARRATELILALEDLDGLDPLVEALSGGGR